MGTFDDINSTGKNAVLNIGALTSAVITPTFLVNGLTTAILSAAAIVAGLTAISTPVIGSFTLSNATVTVVTQSAVVATSIVLPIATNNTAALTVRTQGLFVSAYTVSTSFSVSTQNGSALGTETFQYILFA